MHQLASAWNSDANSFVLLDTPALELLHRASVGYMNAVEALS